MSRRAGIALPELLLVIGCIMAAAAAAAVMATQVQKTGDIDRAAQDLGALIEVIDQGNGSTMGHTSGLSAEHLAHERTAPLHMIRDGALWSRWGPVLVEPLTLDMRRPHAHVRVIYQGIPSDQCRALATAFRPVANALSVNGQSVLDGVALDNAALIAACTRSSTASIAIDHDSGGGGDASLL